MISFSCNDDPKLTRGFYFHPKRRWFRNRQISDQRVYDSTVTYLPTWTTPTKTNRTRKKISRCGLFCFFLLPIELNFRGLMMMSHVKLQDLPSLKLTARTWKWMVGILISFWDPAYFQGLLLLVLGSVWCIFSPMWSIWFRSRALRRWPATWVKPYCARRGERGCWSWGLKPIQGWQ